MMHGSARNWIMLMSSILVLTEKCQRYIWHQTFFIFIADKLRALKGLNHFKLGGFFCHCNLIPLPCIVLLHYS